MIPAWCPVVQIMDFPASVLQGNLGALPISDVHERNDHLARCSLIVGNPIGIHKNPEHL